MNERQKQSRIFHENLCIIVHQNAVGIEATVDDLGGGVTCIFPRPAFQASSFVGEVV